MNVINNWFQKFLADKQVVQLFMLLVLAVVFIVVFGSMLAPAIAAVVLAFLLDGSVTWLQDRGLSKNFSVIFVFMGFVTISLIAFFTILPPIMGQFVQFFGLLPTMVASLQEQVVALPEMFPDLIDENQIRTIIDHIRNEFLIVGQHVVEFSLGNIVNLITILVYVVLVPVMVFFFLKDKEEILKWMAKILPSDRQLSTQVWKEVLARTGDYARGKVYEIIIV
ncbi:MAG: AI-2E family transporter, partial [Sphingomonadales bacterium]|nr:AI-2E family transporter [Sphingomonadales bacterium]